MLRSVTLVTTEVSEGRIASTIKVTRINELGTMITVITSVIQLLGTVNVVPSSPILVILIMEAICSFENSAATTATRCNIPEDGILRSHRTENLKFYKLTFLQMEAYIYIRVNKNFSDNEVFYVFYIVSDNLVSPALKVLISIRCQ
jgi:hypothetical protein